MSRLDGKIALITGGASGFGASTGKILAGEGAKVMLSDLNEEIGKLIAAEIRAGGGQTFFRAADVTDEAQVEALVAETVEAFGRLDAAQRIDATGQHVVDTSEHAGGLETHQITRLLDHEHRRPCRKRRCRPCGQCRRERLGHEAVGDAVDVGDRVQPGEQHAVLLRPERHVRGGREEVAAASGW